MFLGKALRHDAMCNFDIQPTNLLKRDSSTDLNIAKFPVNIAKFPGTHILSNVHERVHLKLRTLEAMIILFCHFQQFVEILLVLSYCYCIVYKAHCYKNIVKKLKITESKNMLKRSQFEKKLRQLSIFKCFRLIFFSYPSVTKAWSSYISL